MRQIHIPTSEFLVIGLSVIGPDDEPALEPCADCGEVETSTTSVPQYSPRYGRVLCYGCLDDRAGSDLFDDPWGGEDAQLLRLRLGAPDYETRATPFRHIDWWAKPIARDAVEPVMDDLCHGGCVGHARADHDEPDLRRVGAPDYETRATPFRHIDWCVSDGPFDAPDCDCPGSRIDQLLARP